MVATSGITSQAIGGENGYDRPIFNLDQGIHFDSEVSVPDAAVIRFEVGSV